MTNKPKGVGLGIALGAALGAALGVAAGHLAIWLSIGVAIGVAIGGSLRRKGIECSECEFLHRHHRTNNLKQQS